MNNSRRPSRRQLFLWLVPSVLLVALGWRLQQHSELDHQPADDRRREATNLAVAALERAIGTTEEKLRDPEAMRFLATTPDSISVTFGDGRLEALPHGRLLYYPVAMPGESAADANFAPGEALEYQRQDFALAARWFQQLARQAPAPVRAGALIRAARNHRKSGEHQAALAAYADAARLATTAIGEVPTELLARWARCDLLDQLGRRSELETEALELRELLLEGRWRITRAVFDVHFQAASHWAGAGEPPANHRLALSEAVQRLWVETSRQKERADRQPGTLVAGGTHFTVLLREHAGRTHALIAGPAFVEQEWIAPIERQHGVRVALDDATASGGSPPQKQP